MARPLVKQLEAVRLKNFELGEALDDLIRAHNNTSQNLQNDPNGADVVPSAAQGLSINTGTQSYTTSDGKNVQIGGGVHVAITDNSAGLGRAVHYFVEYDVTPNFTNPWVEHFGPSRNKMLSLPNGTYYLRTYSQYPAGGPPSAPVSYPQPVVISSSPFPPLLPSQSSGTGVAGDGGGNGAGKVITR